MISAIAAENWSNHLPSISAPTGRWVQLPPGKDGNRKSLEATMHPCPSRQAGGPSGAPSNVVDDSLEHHAALQGQSGSSRSRCQRLSGCWAKEPRNLARLREKPKWAPTLNAEDRHPQGAQVPGGAQPTVHHPRAETVRSAGSRFCGPAGRERVGGQTWCDRDLMPLALEIGRTESVPVRWPPDYCYAGSARNPLKLHEEVEEITQRSKVKASISTVSQRSDREGAGIAGPNSRFSRPPR